MSKTALLLTKTDIKSIIINPKVAIMIQKESDTRVALNITINSIDSIMPVP